MAAYDPKSAKFLMEASKGAAHAADVVQDVVEELLEQAKGGKLNKASR